MFRLVWSEESAQAFIYIEFDIRLQLVIHAGVDERHPFLAMNNKSFDRRSTIAAPWRIHMLSDWPSLPHLVTRILLVPPECFTPIPSFTSKSCARTPS